jgi:hypothetical protein
MVSSLPIIGPGELGVVNRKIKETPKRKGEFEGVIQSRVKTIQLTWLLY